MLDRAALRITKPTLSRMADYAACHKITAEQVTFAGFGLGLLSALLIGFGQSQLALMPLLLSRLADGLDGELARGTGAQSDRGAFLDITLDFLFYASVPLAFAIAEPPQNALAAAALLAAFVGTGASFLAYASIAAKRGNTSADYPSKGIYYLGGLTEGTETILLFVLCCLQPGWFPALAYIFAALCFITIATRIKAGLDAFKSKT